MAHTHDLPPAELARCSVPELHLIDVCGSGPAGRSCLESLGEKEKQEIHKIYVEIMFLLFLALTNSWRCWWVIKHGFWLQA